MEVSDRASVDKKAKLREVRFQVCLVPISQAPGGHGSRLDREGSTEWRRGSTELWTRCPRAPLPVRNRSCFAFAGLTQKGALCGRGTRLKAALQVHTLYTRTYLALYHILLVDREVVFGEGGGSLSRLAGSEVSSLFSRPKSDLPKGNGALF